MLKLFKILKIMSKKRNSGIKNIITFIEYYSIFDNYKFIFEIFLSLAVLHISTCLNIFISRNSFPNWIFQTNLDTKDFFNIYKI